MARVAVVLRTTHANQYFYGRALVFLLYLREMDQRLYNSFVRRTVTVRALLDAVLKDGSALTYRESRHGQRLEGDLLSASDKGEEREWREYQNEMKTSTDPDRKMRLQNILEVAGSRHHSGWIEEIRKKIELTDRFVDFTTPI